MEPVYIYRASCLRVIDGDTFIAAVDLGFGPEKGKPGVTLPLRVRVHGVDAPEVSKPWDKAPDGPGKAAAAFAQLTLTYAPLLIQSYKDDRSFERWVCDVWVAGESYADLLRQAGHVKGLACPMRPVAKVRRMRRPKRSAERRARCEAQRRRFVRRVKAV